mmetsp:Transcript_40809/g.98412  ORF Transcript_40809/g.98412 Transcript_40809/m.98412 type:complete len:542 (+) Transcript_40809:203-1828(+)|eukprot:CAMPEP_0113622342 /NCGR_PEP_ID=MMETSP0017_2-20120614/11444_1 /TAXON_ID=2856 /ORGANISM="Cylindrotheca closterium" /LENGTH=541 /DNA_ID=CAMNT_0000532161 /DNA_START=165 /DNA_END=1790 /DNA_ORIENTATION=- /assembly_acc=CAM_ASM_000147
MKPKSSDNLPLRPAKKQKLSSNEAPLPIHGTNLDTPLRGGSSTNNSRLVTPSLREQNENGETETEFGSSLELLSPVAMKANGMASNKKSIQQDRPNKIPPVQKENLRNRDLTPRGSAKEKKREELKAILLLNGQSVTGSVQVLQTRVADGEAYGKLGICPQCKGGKLKISTENSEFAYCSRKTLCGFQCATHKAPRAEPWACVSFDDDQDVTSPAGPEAPSTATTNTGSSAGWQAGDHKEIRIPSPPTPYWSGQHGPHPILPNHRPTVQHGFGLPAPYHFHYPAQFGFPHDHRQPLYPLHTGYPPLPLPPPPHVPEPPSNYRTTHRVIPPIASRQNRETVMGHGKGWFPMPDPAAFPDRSAARLQRPPPSDEAGAGKNQSHKHNNQSVGNHTPAQVAMATQAAKKALEPRPTEGGNKKWSAEEDEIVRNALARSRSHPFNAWASLAPFLPGRKGKQIRDRWVNHLNPNLLHTPFDEEDDLRLWHAVAAFGTSWKEISVRRFHSKRSENTIKNRWHSVPFRKFIERKFGPNEYKSVIARSKS